MTGGLFYVAQPLMVDTLPNPFGDEIKGIAAASGLPLGERTQDTSVLSCLSVCALNATLTPALV